MGIAIALLGMVISFIGFAMYWANINNSTVEYYINEIFFGMHLFQDQILTLSVLFDVILFAIFYQLKLYRLCRGMLLVVIISVPVILYLY